MIITNRIPKTIYAIMFDKRYGVGNAIAITAGATTEVPVPHDELAPYIGSIHQTIQESPGDIPDEINFHPVGNTHNETRVFIGDALKKLLPDNLKKIFKIMIYCPFCGYKRSVNQIIVRNCVEPRPEGVLDNPFTCWSCQDGPPPTANETP